mgnify:CR=1 FL=1
MSHTKSGPLYIQVADFQGVLFDELAARFDFVAHQDPEHFVGSARITRVPDGHSLVVGGFYGEVKRNDKNKVPVLGCLLVGQDDRAVSYGYAYNYYRYYSYAEGPAAAGAKTSSTVASA